MPSFNKNEQAPLMQILPTQYPNTGRLIGAGVTGAAEKIAAGIERGQKRREYERKQFEAAKNQLKASTKVAQNYLNHNFSDAEEGSPEWLKVSRLVGELADGAAGLGVEDYEQAQALQAKFEAHQAGVLERQRILKAQRDVSDQAMQEEAHGWAKMLHNLKMGQEVAEAESAVQMENQLRAFADSDQSVLNRELESNAELVDAFDGDTERAARERVRSIEENVGQLPRAEFDAEVENQRAHLQDVKARKFEDGIYFKTAEMNSPTTEGSPAWTLETGRKQVDLLNEWIALGDYIADNELDTATRKLFEREAANLAGQMSLFTIPVGTGITGEAESRLSNLDVRLYKETAGNPMKIFAWNSSQRAKVENLRRKLILQRTESLKRSVDLPKNPSAKDFFPNMDEPAYLSVTGPTGNKKIGFVGADGRPYGEGRLGAKEVTEANQLRKQVLRGEFGRNLSSEQQQLFDAANKTEDPDQRLRFLQGIKQYSERGFDPEETVQDTIANLEAQIRGMQLSPEQQEMYEAAQWGREQGRNEEAAQLLESILNLN